MKQTLILIPEIVFLCQYEPPHIHVRKADAEGKYWLYSETFEIDEVYAYNMTPALRREIRQIIFANFDYLVSEYENFH